MLRGIVYSLFLIVFSTSILAAQTFYPEDSFCSDTNSQEAGIYQELKQMVEEGAYEEALERALTYVGEGIEDADIYNLIGYIYMFRKDAARESISYFVKAIELDNNFAYANYNLAFAYHTLAVLNGKREFYEKAIFHYKEFFVLYDSGAYPQDEAQDSQYECAMNLAYALFSIKNYSEAQEYLQRALEYRPNDRDALLALSWVYKLGNSYQQAFQLVNPLVQYPQRYSIVRTSPYYRELLRYHNFLGGRFYGRRWKGPIINQYQERYIIPMFYGSFWGRHYFQRSIWQYMPRRVYRHPRYYFSRYYGRRGRIVRRMPPWRINPYYWRRGTEFVW